MSTYGTYINGEDPNKKKDPNAVGATTPTKSPVLTYEGFVGTGTASNAYQQGVNYAQGIKDSIYGSAEALRKETMANTEAARQRGIIDSQSSYQKAVGTYGANAEALGGMGLTGAGYGEYLTANAYAAHRGQVQDINANALAANREAASLEAQTKAAAESEYLKNLYSLGTEFDAAKDTAYNAILTAISEGTSLDVAKQSGAWGDLTPEQQNTISKSYYDGGLSYLISAEESAGGAYSKSEAESALRGAGYGEADISNIIASWQESNYKKLSNDSNLTEETVKTAESEGMITAEQANELKPSSTVSPRKVTHIKDLSYELDGERIGIEKQADSKTLDTLNELYPDSYLIYVELNGNGYIALGGGRWGKTRKRASK